ncbi:MAG: FAD-binding oxidoreductase [Methyloligellaceae bacterium]
MTDNTQSLHQAPSAEVLDRFAGIVGDKFIIRDEKEMTPYLNEWRDRYVGKAACVLLPANTKEVSKIMATAYEHNIAVVPQGGNTGLVGGQIPYERGNEIVVSLSRMDRIYEVNTRNNSMTVEAGVILENARRAANDAGRLYPLSFGSKKKCQVGGNLATNAGGLAVLRYGSARNLVLGLEVVLADGQVWDGMRALRKDNSGYSMKDIFVGSEGTLGIITKAVLKLVQKPAETVTALIGVDSLQKVADLYSLGTAIAGQKLTAFEMLPQIAMELLIKHSEESTYPLENRYPWYVMIELSGTITNGQAGKLIKMIYNEAKQSGQLSEGFITETEEQSQQLWDMRSNMSLVQKLEGGSIKHDVSVPIARIPEFIERANDMVEIMVPGARPVPFGHYGDGNVHYNISQPVSMDKKTFLAQWECLSAAVHEIVIDLGGSISAEHGIGRMKRELLSKIKTPVELEMMHRIKKALDPKGILNPNKVL